MAFQDITITSIDTISAFDITSGNFLFMIDELQNATIAQEEEKTPITGKQGRKLNSLKKNKAVTISGTNGMVSTGLLGLQTGSTFETKESTKVMCPDFLTVKAGATTVTTTYKAAGTAGAEIKALYTIDDKGGRGVTYKQTAQGNGDREFKYNPSDKTITFHAALSAEKDVNIVAVYERNIKADVHTNMSDNYASKCQLYIDAMGEDKCANIYRVQFLIPKADFSGSFSLEMGDNQTVHAFEAESLSGACGAAGVLWQCSIYGKDEADVEASEDSGLGE